MGTSYSAKAVIGCEITGKLFYEATEAVPCAHNPTIGVAYCPMCGKKQYEPTWKLVDAAKWADDESLILVGDLPVVFAGYLGNKAHELRAFVGIVATSDSYNDYATRLDGKDLAQWRDLVKQQLEPIGMWDESTFGLWAVLSVG